MTRLGSNDPRELDVRIIAATNRDLEAMTAGGLFREDLLYRINVFPVTLPPLRDRLDDIPLLAEHFLKKHRSLTGNPLKGFSPSCIHDMMNYAWRGNIRELENLIKRAIITTEGEIITRLDIRGTSVEGRPGVESPLTTSIPYKAYVDQVLRDAEKEVPDADARGIARQHERSRPEDGRGQEDDLQEDFRVRHRRAGVQGVNPGRGRLRAPPPAPAPDPLRTAYCPPESTPIPPGSIQLWHPLHMGDMTLSFLAKSTSHE